MEPEACSIWGSLFPVLRQGPFTALPSALWVAFPRVAVENGHDRWGRGAVLPDPLGWSCPWPWVVFSHACTDPFSCWVHWGSLWGVLGFLLCAITSFLVHRRSILVQRFTDRSHISCIILCLLRNPPVEDDLEIPLASQDSCGLRDPFSSETGLVPQICAVK